ncbi:hypothetical protein ONZ45_g17882 [Pleurotus djamor]|nr:hypothetical protein ONZ45_g17882 [Pleurotus djamor]
MWTLSLSALALFLASCMTLYIITSSTERQKNSAAVAFPSVNFALLPGAQVIPSLTSPPYDCCPSSSFLDLIKNHFYTRWFGFNASKLRLSRPREALNEDLDIANFWEFEGSTGHIGILLHDYVVPSQVFIDNPPIESLLPAQRRSIPRTIRVWGLVDPSTVRAQPSKSPYQFAKVAPLPSSVIPPTYRVLNLSGNTAAQIGVVRALRVTSVVLSEVKGKDRNLVKIGRPEAPEDDVWTIASLLPQKIENVMTEAFLEAPQEYCFVNSGAR